MANSDHWVQEEAYIELFDDLYPLTTGDYYSGGVTVTSSGTASAAQLASIPGVNGHPGVIQLSATSTNGNIYLTSMLTGHLVPPIILRYGELAFSTLLRIPTLGTAAQQFGIVSGISTQGQQGASFDSFCPDHGLWFRYAYNQNGGAWRAGTSAGVGNITNVNTTVPVVANTWYLLTARINAAGTDVSFYIDNSYVGRSTTNIPPATVAGMVGLLPGVIFRGAGGTARTLQIDYYRLTQRPIRIEPQIS